MVIHRLVFLETCYVYKLVDNVSAKVFSNSTLSLLIILQIRQAVPDSLVPLMGRR